MDASAYARQSFVPDVIAPSSAVLEAASAAYLTAEERREFRVLHGMFDDTDLDTPTRRARIALEGFDLLDPVFADPSVPRALTLSALAARGAHAEILAATESATDLLSMSFRAAALARIDRKAEALQLAAAPSAISALTEATTIDDILAAVDLGRCAFVSMRVRQEHTHHCSRHLREGVKALTDSIQAFARAKQSCSLSATP